MKTRTFVNEWNISSTICDIKKQKDDLMSLQEWEFTHKLICTHKAIHISTNLKKFIDALLLTILNLPKKNA